MRKPMIIAALLPLIVGGCVSTVASVVKAPFQAAGKAVDWTTTSQEESDRNYGRKMRKQEAEEGKRRKEADKACRKNPAKCQSYGYAQPTQDYERR